MRKYIHVYNISSELYANQSALNIRGEDRGFSSCLYEMVYYITFMEEDLQLWYSFVSVNILIKFLLAKRVLNSELLLSEDRVNSD